MLKKRSLAEAKAKLSECVHDVERGDDDERQKQAAKEAIELAQSVHSLFLMQTPHEQRELLQHVLSNCFLRDGKVDPEYRKPFQLLTFAAKEFANEKSDPGPDDPRSAFKWA